MTTDSPFAVRPDPAPAPAAANATATATPASTTPVIASFSYNAFRRALASQVNQIGGHLNGVQTLVEGLEEEDMAFDETGAYDDDFDQAAISTCDDIIVGCQETVAMLTRIAERANKFRSLVQARLEAPEEGA